MTRLNRGHFERRESASIRDNLLAAAADVGLDREAANAFLESKELESEVWKSYGTTIQEKNIHSIPLFVYSVPSIGASGGPFREAGKREPWVVSGSMDEGYFFDLFETICHVVGVAGMRETRKNDGTDKKDDTSCSL